MSSGGSGTYAGIFVNADNATVDSNTVRNFVSVGIRLFQCRNTSCTDNVLTDDSLGAMTRGIWDYQNTDCYISDNIIRVTTTSIWERSASSKIFNNIGYNYNGFFPYYNQSSSPTMLDDSWAYWYNNAKNFFYIVCRVNNTVFYYNTTKTI